VLCRGEKCRSCVVSHPKSATAAAAASPYLISFGTHFGGHSGTHSAKMTDGFDSGSTGSKWPSIYSDRPCVLVHLCCTTQLIESVTQVLARLACCVSVRNVQCDPRTRESSPRRQDKIGFRVSTTVGGTVL